jgi:hypothetical protein
LIACSCPTPTASVSGRSAASGARSLFAAGAAVGPSERPLLPKPPRRRAASPQGPDVVVSRTRTATPSDGWLMYDSERYRYKHIRPCIFVNPSTGATIHGLPEFIINPVRKMIVCSPDLIAAIINGNTAVGFYRPGAPSWSISPAPSCRSYKDIALCHGKLYALSEGEELFSHELLIDAGGGRVVEHVINERASPVYDKCYPYERYLVASCDKLFLVRWWYSLWVFLMMDPSMEQKCDAIKMQVFEADLEMGRWREVKDDGLDGQALFVSRNCSKGVRLCTNDPRFQGDRVYFLGAELDLIDTGFFMPYTCGSYDMRNDRVSELFLKRTWKITDRRRGRPEWFFPCM